MYIRLNWSFKMAARFLRKCWFRKHVFTQYCFTARLIQKLRYQDRTIFFGLREFNSASGCLNFENLAAEAEKIVGYQTSLLRCLLSDEISSVLVHSKKLVGSRHPLLKTARKLVYDGAGSFDAIGLVVLLMSRNGEGLTVRGAPLGQDPISGIQQKQRKLAEVAEMINTAFMVHLGMVNKSNFESLDDVKTMNFGNKITVLTGDFLLAKASVGLSELQNADVVDLMAGVIGDIVEAEMLKDYKTLQETSLTNWEEIVFKSRGSLYAKSCSAALKLCSLSQHYQDAAFAFGKNLGFLQQLAKDHQELDASIKTISANNVLIIENKHKLPSNILENPVNTLIPKTDNIKQILENFENKQKMQNLASNYGDKALESLQLFPTSDAKHCLQNLVKQLVAL